ncbi:hypothetical protein PoB_006491600 [Plakobranchus ocellatus]|uniref:Uncharacterized protein n=1 Tax=Plakobranchus ocellatus TaxID=259542 RepID=A0AAV4D2K9_9GAST|nr:hypothetical protein PoB_006491600 [Plakobranchus ocellatus]
MAAVTVIGTTSVAFTVTGTGVVAAPAGDVAVTVIGTASDAFTVVGIGIVAAPVVFYRRLRRYCAVKVVAIAAVAAAATAVAGKANKLNVSIPRTLSLSLNTQGKES